VNAGVGVGGPGGLGQAGASVGVNAGAAVGGAY